MAGGVPPHFGIYAAMKGGLFAQCATLRIFWRPKPRCKPPSVTLLTVRRRSRRVHGLRADAMPHGRIYRAVYLYADWGMIDLSAAAATADLRTPSHFKS